MSKKQYKYCTSIEIMVYLYSQTKPMDKQQKLEKVLIESLSHMLKRSVQVSQGDQLAIAQEYKEWINCQTVNDFSKLEILLIDKCSLY